MTKKHTYLIIIIALAMVIIFADHIEAAPYAYSVDSFKIEGNLPQYSVDEFPWFISSGTASEGGGNLTLTSPGEVNSVQIGNYILTIEMTDIGSYLPGSDLYVEDERGSFTATSRWTTGAPKQNQWFLMESSIEKDEGGPIDCDEIQIGVYKIQEPVLAYFLGCPVGTFVAFGNTKGGPVQIATVDEDEITGDILLALTFDDHTNNFLGSFSLDGGTTYKYPFYWINTQIGNGGYFKDWELTAVSANIEPAPANSRLYFPHIATEATWGSEIAVINSSSSQLIHGTLRAYDNAGNEVDHLELDLFPNGRKEINIGNEFGSSSGINYAVYESDRNTVLGYTKFFIEGRYRVAVPAVSQPNTGEFYISHIASNSDWWTGISLVNTTSSDCQMTLLFDNGMSKSILFNSKEHKAFTISSLFDGQTPSNINSAIVTGCNGVVGLELFGSTESSGMNYLSGVLLKNTKTTNIYYPHIASDSYWWTGIVAYNPSSTPCAITVRPYTQNGTGLDTQTLNLQGKSKYIGTAADLKLPAGTAWFEIEASSPITGFELFGTNNGNQLAGYTGVGISGTERVFPKIDDEGWTGIAFVNIEDDSASITLTAYDDDGNAVAVEYMTLDSHSKVVGLPEDLFSASIYGATYIRYTSDREVVGFQLNGSNDNMMLDALPGL